MYVLVNHILVYLTVWNKNIMFGILVTKKKDNISLKVERCPQFYLGPPLNMAQYI